MPASRYKSNQYVGRAAAASARIVPGADNRVQLTIQNTGANAGRVRFGNDVQNDGGDLLFAPMDIFKWEQNAPQDAINVQSTLGTTFAIIEGVILP